MNVVEALLAKNLIPVLSHTNDTYALIEDHGRSAATGLLHRQGAVVNVAVTHSVHSNAYSFRADGEYVITVTDRLLQRLEEAICGYLDASEIKQYIATTLGITYESGLAWPTGMAWGAKPRSQRAAVADDARIALFYEILDDAWFFSVLHETAHIGSGDVDGDRAVPANFENKLANVLDLMSYGGVAANRHARYAEFDADRNAACWMMQIVLRKYVETPAETDPFALAHVVLAAFGMMSAILQIAHHEPDTPETTGKMNHPSFEIRLVGMREGTEAVLTDQGGPLAPHVSYQVLHAITQLRRAMETIALGAPSKYMITV